MTQVMKEWKAQMEAVGINMTDISMDAMDQVKIDPALRNTTTRFMVVHAPPGVSQEVINLLSDQPQVDWIEQTPGLAFFNKWAKGITQSGDWQVNYFRYQMNASTAPFYMVGVLTPVDCNPPLLLIPQSQPFTAAGLLGNGQILGVADTGIDMNSCFFKDGAASIPFDTVSKSHRKLVTYIAFADRLENYDSSPNSQDPIGHGTHVSGTLAGVTTGTMSAFNGLATGSKLAFMDIAKYDNSGAVQLYPPSDLNLGMFTLLYNAGARVLSMSWGSPDSNCYSSYAVMVDEFLWNHPEALIVFAAGNSGQNGDYTVVTPSTAKNCLTVGASYNMIQSSFQTESNLNYVAYFSSAGPTSDGRIKPDVLAPGYYITSAHNGDTCGVVMSRGTSMATPVTAANAALVREYFMTGKYRGKPLLPSGALLKAVMVHSGQAMKAYEDAQGTLHSVRYPDHHQGYGRIELDQVIDLTNRKYTLQVFGSANTSDPRYRHFTKTGDLHQYKVTINNSTKVPSLKATLVWTDKPSSPTSCEKSAISVLTNDLDLKIIGPGGATIFYPVSMGGTGPDRSNNVEVVVVPNPIPGGNYTIQVLAKSLVTSQPYALVFTGHFIGNSYNSTEGDLGDPSGLWGDLKALLKANDGVMALIIVILVFSFVFCVGCIRYQARLKDKSRNHPNRNLRPKGPGTDMGNLTSNPSLSPNPYPSERRQSRGEGGGGAQQPLSRQGQQDYFMASVDGDYRTARMHQQL